MYLLTLYVFIALFFSFLCSIAEAVILSISPAHIAVMEQNEQPAGKLLSELKTNIDRPLAAILTLNTIAHTIGAAGAGAQAAVVFGSASVGIASAILTLLILVFSEIIPKTLGAYYNKYLATPTAYGLKYLIIVLYPFVMLSEFITKRMTKEPVTSGLNRQEFRVFAQLSEAEGLIATQEASMLQNMMSLSEIRVDDVMTPRPVIFSLPHNLKVQEFFYQYDQIRYSRIPIYDGDKERINGFVLRSDLLLAQARGNTLKTVDTYRRDIQVMPSATRLNQAFTQMLSQRSQMVLVVDEYGSTRGIVTIEDIIETILGLEIVDEGDKAEDMQQHARRLWRKRAKSMGIDAIKLHSDDKQD